MFDKISNWWLKKKTKNFTQIPFFAVLFNFEKYVNSGEKGSCDIMIHPDLEEDFLLESMIRDCVDYIRDNYDMENFTRI